MSGKEEREEWPLTCCVIDAEERCERIALGNESVSYLAGIALIAVLGVDVKNLRARQRKREKREMFSLMIGDVNLRRCSGNAADYGK